MCHFQDNFIRPSQIYVIRPEHMLDDLIKVEVMLGAPSNQTFTELHPHRVDSQSDLPKHDQSFSKQLLLTKEEKQRV